MLLEAGYCSKPFPIGVGMNRLPEVETAKQLMKEAMKWSVMKWLREKRRVRRIADEANAALDRCSDEVRLRWPENLRVAYEILPPETSNPQSGSRTPTGVPVKHAESSRLARKLKNADHQAYRARMLAEHAFDDAEKKLSTSLAREGCVKAIVSWELYEKAIANSEKFAM
jgi:hypothetical protein